MRDVLYRLQAIWYVLTARKFALFAEKGDMYLRYTLELEEDEIDDFVGLQFNEE